MKLPYRLPSIGAAYALMATLLSPVGSTLPQTDAYAAPPSQPFASVPFLRTWQRTDRPVNMGQVQRSFFWGPEANSAGLLEDYEQGIGGKRLVQYIGEPLAVHYTGTPDHWYAISFDNAAGTRLKVLSTFNSTYYPNPWYLDKEP